jgi:gluconate 2-dehydrogenase gamma chain
MSLVQLGDLSRRSLLKRIALGLTAMELEQMTVLEAQEVHSHTEAEKKLTGVYQPKLFNEHEYRTVTRLAELIVPADDVSGSAVDAGAPEFIDLLASHNMQLADIYTGGIAWLDAHARAVNKTTFLEAGPQRQVALLEELVEARAEQQRRRQDGSSYENSEHKDFRGYGVYQRNDLGPGVVFFNWVCRMTIDAFYTSPIGIKDIGYLGNSAMTQYVVPEQAINYALKRSPFA